MLKKMIKLEVQKAFRNQLFYCSIIIGCAITMLSFFDNISAYQNDLIILAESNTNPMQESTGLFNLWIGGEPFSLGSAIYFFVFPLLVAIPYGWSYCEEKQCGYTKMMAVRSGKMNYFMSKYIAVFLSGGLTMVIPLLFNFLLTSMFVPAVVPSPVYCTSSGIFFYSLMSRIYYTMPLLYVFLYLCIDFFFCGFIACISYNVAGFVKYRLVAVLFPMFLLLGLHYSRQFIYTSMTVKYKEISPMFFLRPVAAAYEASWMVIITEMIVLFAATFILSIVWERGHEIY